jgi:RNA polymerase sigma-70 factor (ECF subfamily)
VAIHTEEVGALQEQNHAGRFDAIVLPHLDAAFNLARWITGNSHDAEDVVQEACMRAHRFLAGFHGSDGRAWLLAIVRNTAYSWMKRNRPAATVVSFEEAIHSEAAPNSVPGGSLLQQEAGEMLRHGLDGLPTEFREIIVLRELEGLSYKEIAGIVGVPLGTVMSRLARARERLQQALTKHMSEES